MAIASDLTNGTGLGQINAQWNRSRSLSASGVHEYSLDNLTKEVFGSSFTLSFMSGYLKGFEVEVTSTGVNQGVIVEFTGTNPFTNLFGSTGVQIPVHAESTFQWSSFQDGIQITNNQKEFQVRDLNGGAASYSIVLLAATGL